MSKHAVMPLSDYVDICDTVRGHLKIDDKLTSDAIPPMINEVFRQGGNEAYAPAYDKGYAEGKNVGFGEGKEAYAEELLPYNHNLQQAVYVIPTGRPIEEVTEQAASDLNAIKGKIEEKGVDIPFLTPSSEYPAKIEDVYGKGYEQGESKGFEAGKKSQYDEFWDLRQNYGNEKGVNYEYAFYLFPGELFNPKYDFIFGTDYSANNTFSYSTITDMQKDCYFSMPSPSVCGVSSTFYRCKKLVNARTLHCPSGLQWNYYTFRECESLVEIRFEGVVDTEGLNLQWSTKLSKASWQSIIGCYAVDLTLSMTGSKTSVDKAFETSEGANDGSTSAEWLNLLATRPNLTVNLI